MFETNEYFDGQVKSLAFQTETLPATVGVMAPGDYQFSTTQKEAMTVVNGVMTVKLATEDEWRRYAAGTSFEIPANSSFEVSVTRDTAYLCLYG